MSLHPHVIGKSYLSVITTPESMSRAALAHFLSRHSGLDERTLHLRLGLVPPLIVGLVDEATAADAVRAVVAAGGDAFAPGMADIQSLGPTLKVRDMELRHGYFQMELWRGPSVNVTAQEIQIVVRARTPGAPVEPLRYESSVRPFMGHIGAPAYLGGPAIGLALGLGGAYGLARLLHGSADDIDTGVFGELPAVSTPQIMPSHKLDLHTVDGRVLQIDGDKFGYRILGDLRGHSDNTNIDRMCELFVHLNPDVVVDTYFGTFLPPPSHHRIRLSLMKINNDHPAFAFYSRWCALMYRHVMGKR